MIEFFRNLLTFLSHKFNEFRCRISNFDEILSYIKSVVVKNYVFNDRNDSTPSILTLNDSQSKWYCDYSTVIFSATFFPTMWFLVFFAGLAFIVIKCSNVEKTDSKNNVDVESNMKRTRLEVICKN